MYKDLPSAILICILAKVNSDDPETCAADLKQICKITLQHLIFFSFVFRLLEN